MPWYYAIAVSARCHKLTGAKCLRLPRDRFFPILKMFPDEEEKMAEAALSSFEQARSRLVDNVL